MRTNTTPVRGPFSRPSSSPINGRLPTEPMLRTAISCAPLRKARNLGPLGCLVNPWEGVMAETRVRCTFPATPAWLFETFCADGCLRTRSLAFAPDSWIPRRYASNLVPHLQWPEVPTPSRRCQCAASLHQGRCQPQLLVGLLIRQLQVLAVSVQVFHSCIAVQNAQSPSHCKRAIGL